MALYQGIIPISQGQKGNGISSIVLLSGDHSSGTYDTYRITFTDGTTFDYQVYNGKDDEYTSIIVVNTDAAPALGILSDGAEYRCTNTSITTAPTMTIAAIASTSTKFISTIVFKAPNSTAPVITNNSGYTIKYIGQDIVSGVWTPVIDTVYHLSFVFDGIYLNAYISGVI